MTNALIILLGYGCYLMLVGIILMLSWYSEKLDPTNQLPDSIWDEIFPDRKNGYPRKTPTKQAQQTVPIQIKHVLDDQRAA